MAASSTTRPSGWRCRSRARACARPRSWAAWSGGRSRTPSTRSCRRRRVRVRGSGRDRVPIDAAARGGRDAPSLPPRLSASRAHSSTPRVRRSSRSCWRSIRTSRIASWCRGGASPPPARRCSASVLRAGISRLRLQPRAYRRTLFAEVRDPGGTLVEASRARAFWRRAGMGTVRVHARGVRGRRGSGHGVPRRRAGDFGALLQVSLDQLYDACGEIPSGPRGPTPLRLAAGHARLRAARGRSRRGVAAADRTSRSWRTRCACSGITGFASRTSAFRPAAATSPWHASGGRLGAPATSSRGRSPGRTAGR